jgi:hypothetical protein
MRALALVLVLLAMAGCAPDDPRTQAPRDPVKECAAQGGTIQRVGFSQALACVIPYPDAGKPCRDKADCKGECWTASPIPGADGRFTGTCQPTNLPFSCHARITDGKAGPILCVD